VPTIRLRSCCCTSSTPRSCHKPRSRCWPSVTAERKREIEKARAASPAEARTADYEQRLREARMHYSKARRRAANGLAGSSCRSRPVTDEGASSDRTSAKGIEQDKRTAQSGPKRSGRLAAEIIRMVLQPAPRPARGPQHESSAHHALYPPDSVPPCSGVHVPSDERQRSRPSRESLRELRTFRPRTTSRWLRNLASCG